MFNKLLFPIASCVSVGGVGVAFTKYNNQTVVTVDSFLDTNKNQFVGGGGIDFSSNKVKEKKPEEYFYTVVNTDREITDSQNIECEQAVPFVSPKTKFPCVLFDCADSKNSNIAITEIEEKINNEPLNLSLVTTVQNNKYYLLRTETAINNETTKIAIKSRPDDTTLAALDLQNDWGKNIQKSKSK